jgi:hypothetical protein
MGIISRLAALALALMVFPWAGVRGGNSPEYVAEKPATAANSISGKAHYVLRDGLRIYLWEKHKAGLEDSFATSGKVALLVCWWHVVGTSDFDLQIRDYSLMDWLATNGYDVGPSISTDMVIPTRRIRIGRGSSLPPLTSTRR